MRNAFSNAFGASGGGADATKLPLAGGALTGQLIQSTNGAASTPPLLLNGTIFTGGSAATTKPAQLIEPTGTTSTGWSTLGTAYGANMPTGFQGRYFDGKINGVSKTYLEADSIGKTTFALNTFLFQGDFGGSNRMRMGGSIGGFYFEPNNMMALGAGSYIGWTATASGPGNNAPDLAISREAAACLKMGLDAAGVTNQHFKACNRITSDGAGANLTISGGNGRGDYGGNLLLSYYAPGGSGVAGTLTTALTLSAEGFFAYAEGINLTFGASTGTKFGTADSQKLAFWNKTPIVQPTTAITAATFANNSSGIVDDTATYGGYSMGQIAAALINVGILF